MFAVNCCAKSLLRQTFRNQTKLLKFNNNNIGLNQSFVRLRHSARINTVIVFVPQQEAWIIERMGKFNKILGILHLILVFY